MGVGEQIAVFNWINSDDFPFLYLLGSNWKHPAVVLLEDNCSADV